MREDGRVVILELVTGDYPIVFCICGFLGVCVVSFAIFLVLLRFFHLYFGGCSLMRDLASCFGVLVFPFHSGDWFY